MKKFTVILAAGILLLTACVPPAGAPTAPVETTPTQAVAPATIQPGTTPIEATTQAPPPALTDTPAVAPSPSTTPANGILHLAGGSKVTITGMRMFSPSDGWGTGGSDGASDHVLKTQDGGSTWLDVTPPEPAPASGEQRMVEAFFFNPDIAWAIYYTSGAPPSTPRSSVWRTRDGGASWMESDPLDISNLNEFFVPSNLQFVDLQNGWLLAHAGVGMNHDYVALFRSTDGGQTWQRLIDPYGDSTIQSCSKNRMLFITPQDGWLTGDCNGVAPGVLLFKTSDGGATWVDVQLPPPADIPDLYGNDFVAACGSYTPVFFDTLQGSLVVQCVFYSQDPVVTKYYLYSTTDGGSSWTSAPYPGGALFFADPTHGLALGKEIYQTGDGGSSWKRVGVVTWDADFSFIDMQTGWAVARDGDQIALVQTGNGGGRWTLLEPQIAP